MDAMALAAMQAGNEEVDPLETGQTLLDEWLAQPFKMATVANREETELRQALGLST
jgi:hypothetical protein